MTLAGGDGFPPELSVNGTNPDGSFRAELTGEYMRVHAFDMSTVTAIGGDLDGQACLVLTLDVETLDGRRGRPAPVVLVVSNDDELDTLDRTFREAIAALRGALGYVERETPVLCPGCGRRLFGDVALRGGCLNCYPSLPTALDGVGP